MFLLSSKLAYSSKHSRRFKTVEIKKMELINQPKIFVKKKKFKKVLAPRKLKKHPKIFKILRKKCIFNMKKYLVNLKIKKRNFFMYKFKVQKSFHKQYFFVKKRSFKKFFFSKFQNFFFFIKIKRFNKIVNFLKEQKLQLKN